jgi:four helix bundle protein
MSRYDNVEDMPIYQHFYQLALEIEQKTRVFDSDFKWLRNQLLRASESVPANMSEGFYSQYSTEYLQSLYRCRREARETITHLSYARDVSQLTNEVSDVMINNCNDGLQQLANLIGSIERKIQIRGKSKSVKKMVVPV